MATAFYQDLKFQELKKQIQENNNLQNLKTLRVHLYKYFYRDFEFNIDFKTNNGMLICNNQTDLTKILNIVLEEINHYLINIITGKKTKYINFNSKIPLIGHNAFGITDRNTNILEIKPITSCNLNCIFCSVDQSKRENDFVIEKDYIIYYYKKLSYIKKQKITVVINSHGEPTLYYRLPELIKDLKKIEKTERIILLTNGTLLNKDKLKELKEAGLDQINFSVNAFTQKKAKELSGNNAYDLKQVLKTIALSKDLFDILIAPVYIKGYNDEEIEKIVEFGSKDNIPIAIQNFLNYKTGKNPIKAIDFQEFYNFLRELETKYNKNLTDLEKEFKNIFKNKDYDFKIKEDKVLTIPFKKKEIINARIVSFGGFSNEKIGIVDNIDRVISILNSNKKINQYQKAKIIRTKHNIFVAEAL